MKTLPHQTLCAFLCLVIIGNAACTSMQTIDATPGTVAEHNIEPGDQLTLYFADNSHKEIAVTEVSESSITGTDSDGQQVIADYDELVTMSFKEIDGSKTAKAVGIVALGVLVVSAAATAEILSGWSYR